MNDNSQLGKPIAIFVFIFAAVIAMTYICNNQIFAASSSSSGNQTKASNPSGPLTPYSSGPHSNPPTNTPFNPSKANPNNTETIKSFTAVKGNNSEFLKGNKPISNPHNNVGNSLGINANQSH